MEMTKKELLVEKITASVNEDQEFYKAIISAPDAATLQTVLKENGFDFTIAEIEECFTDGVTEILNYQAEELSENQLDDVAGGGFFRGTARLIVSCGVGFGHGGHSGDSQQQRGDGGNHYSFNGLFHNG